MNILDETHPLDGPVWLRDQLRLNERDVPRREAARANQCQACLLLQRAEYGAAASDRDRIDLEPPRAIQLALPVSSERRDQGDQCRRNKQRRQQIAHRYGFDL